MLPHNAYVASSLLLFASPYLSATCIMISYYGENVNTFFKIFSKKFFSRKTRYLSGIFLGYKGFQIVLGEHIFFVAELADCLCLALFVRH